MNIQSGIADRVMGSAARRAVEMLESRTLLSGAGLLDASFGAGGLVVDPLRTTSQFEQIIPLAGNKLLAAGSIGSVGHRNFVLVRFNSNGKIDTTFGKSGKVVTDFGGDDFVSDVELAQGNKIVLLGRGGSHGDLAVARYGLDGKLDTT